MADNYDESHKAFLLEFLQRSNALARDEIVRLRDVSVGDEGIFSALIGNLETSRLAISSEGVRLKLRVGDLGGVLYQARFDGPTPDIKVKEGVVTIRYPRRLWLPSTEKRVAEITLNPAIPWAIVIRSGGSDVSAELDGLNLIEMEVNGAGSMFRVDLPEPSSVVPIQLGGSGSEFIVRRPFGVAARVQRKGWGSGVVFDDQTVGEISSDNRLQSPNYEDTSLSYDIETSGSGSMITITSG